jgi:hypothetical protein
MSINGLVSKITLTLCLGGVSHAYAESVTDPINTFGIIASHNKYMVELDGFEYDTGLKRTQGGLFYTFGNKLTGHGGLIYQIGVEGQYSQHNELTYKSAKAEFDIGARAALSTYNYVDIILGGGYSRDRIELEFSGLPLELHQTTKSPFAKAGLGYSYLTPNHTIRVEVGARYSIDPRVEVQLGGPSESVDLENKVNPYGELSVLWNKKGMPISTSLYYMNTHYQIENNISEVKQRQIGMKVGLAF